MPQYRKKPVIIEAIQFTKDFDRAKAPKWFKEALSKKANEKGSARISTSADYIQIMTLEGVHTANLDDYLIQGVKGEIYPCKPDIFDMTYELVPDGTITEQGLQDAIDAVVKDEVAGKSKGKSVQFVVRMIVKDGEGSTLPTPAAYPGKYKITALEVYENGILTKQISIEPNYSLAVDPAAPGGDRTVVERRSNLPTREDKRGARRLG